MFITISKSTGVQAMLVMIPNPSWTIQLCLIWKIPTHLLNLKSEFLCEHTESDDTTADGWWTSSQLTKGKCLKGTVVGIT